MSYDSAIKSLSNDALCHIQDNSTVGLGSGRAATALTKALAEYIQEHKYHIICVPTSLQIKTIAEELEMNLVTADQIKQIDIVYDGVDQIDDERFVIKGGGGALLRENILFGLAKKIVVMADETKFVTNLTRSVPVEVHPQARTLVIKKISDIGGVAGLRTGKRGYPIFTENGNIILDCDFGLIKDPRNLTIQIKQIPGVLESGIFLRRPDIIYKAKSKGKFDIIRI